MAKKPLKIFHSGLEFEYFLINESGKLVFNADKILKDAVKIDPKAQLAKECSKGMVELNNYPKPEPNETINEMLSAVRALIEAAEKNDTLLLPLSCYPGKNKTDMRSGNGYGIKKKIFGANKFRLAGKCVGFHFHFTMPKGVMDKEKLVLKRLINSKLKSSMMNAYNFLIAADPVLLTVMASSPFYELGHLAKDSRALVYRGGRKLKYGAGLYSKLPIFGALPPYKQTLADLRHSINRRNIIWKGIMKKHGMNPNRNWPYKSKLDLFWGPVRVNKHDTLEQRGIDMNNLDNVMGMTAVLNYVLEEIQTNFLQVVPSDIGLEEPFKREGNILYIPPHTYVRNNLQYRSAKNGFESKSAKDYVKRFFSFAKTCIPKNKMQIAKPVFNIVSEEKSLSDEILSYSKSKGFNPAKGITPEFAGEISVKFAENYLRSVGRTESLLEKYF